MMKNLPFDVKFFFSFLITKNMFFTDVMIVRAERHENVQGFTRGGEYTPPYAFDCLKVKSCYKHKMSF